MRVRARRKETEEIRTLRWNRSHLTRFLVVLASLAGAYYCATKLRAVVGAGNAQESGLVQAGQVEKKEKTLLRKGEVSLLWDNLSSAQNFFWGDAVSTGADSSASLRLKDGTEITLARSSLVVISRENNQISIQIHQGEIKLKKPKRPMRKVAKSVPPVSFGASWFSRTETAPAPAPVAEVETQAAGEPVEAEAPVETYVINGQKVEAQETISVHVEEKTGQVEVAKVVGKREVPVAVIETKSEPVKVVEKPVAPPVEETRILAEAAPPKIEAFPPAPPPAPVETPPPTPPRSVPEETAAAEEEPYAEAPDAELAADEKNSFWLDLGVGANFSAYDQSVPGMSNLNFGGFEIPTLSLSGGKYVFDDKAVFMQLRSTSFHASSSDSITVLNSGKSLTSVSASLLSGLDPSVNAHGASLGWRLGVQYQSAPLFVPTRANQVDVQAANFLGVHAVLDYRWHASAKLKFEAGVGAHYNLLSNSNEGSQVNFSGNYGVSGHLGGTYQLAQHYHLGLSWEGQYQQQQINFMDSAGKAYQGNQNLLSSNLDLKLGVEF